MTARTAQNALKTQAGLTDTQAAQRSGADLHREALRVKGGLTANQIATMDGARLAQVAGYINTTT